MGISMKTTSGKLLASAALVATAAGVAGLGTYGAFTDTTAADQKVAAGTVDIALGAGSGKGFDVMATDVLPGDAIERVVTLKNNGTSSLDSIYLTTSVAASSPLTADTVNGLQVSIERCSTAWSGTSAPYTCGGTVETVLAASPVIMVGGELANVQSLTPGQEDNLKVSAVLPEDAGNEFQGAASTVTFSFNATQRAAETK
ncbi:TasA family protein [Crystallibacter degradans]|uniref:TasA family protein n=1 Tax=Crystallibacter degradans TaxID=2726743 RepID=UPI00147352BA|nr:TasA family protein [Arthrobacter sp. SF27]NMR28155.1 hypothetical protein [Arthrobacter sp. SF27]